MRKYSLISTIWVLSLLFIACEPQEMDDYELGKVPAESDVSFSVTPKADQANVVTFENTSPLPGIVVWDLGNGSKGKGQSFTAEYPFAGTYNVSMILYSEGGSVSKQYSLVVAEDDLSLLEHPLYTVLTGGAENPSGKTWVIDQYVAGNLGLSPNDAFSPIWWEAGANEKLESSYFDQKYTFKQVGVEMIWENQGSVYTNGAGKDDLIANGYGPAVQPPAGDFDVEYTPKDKYTFSLNTSDSTLTISDGGFLGFYMGTSEFKILSIDSTHMYVRGVSTVEIGNAWYAKLVVEEYNIEPPKVPIPNKEIPLLESFEDKESSVVFEGEAMGDLSIAGYQNPAPVPINSSSKVYLYEKKAGEFYSNISFVADGYKFDLSEQNKITLKVFIPSYNDYVTGNNVAGEWVANKLLQSSIAVKLQNADMGGNAYQTQTEILKTGLEKDKWLELTFDFSGVADNEDYNKIVIQFGTEGHDGGGIFFFDDFSFDK